MRSFAVLVVALLALVSIWWLVHPPRDAPEYRERAAQTAELLRSQVQTARIWADAVGAGRVTHNAAAIGFADSERAAQSTAASLQSWDPPPGTGALRERLTARAADTTAALGGLRIAAHRGDWEAVPPAARELAPLARALERLEARARR